MTTHSGGFGSPPLGTKTERRELCWNGSSGQPEEPNKARTRGLKSPLVERRKARGLKPMRPLRMKVRFYCTERRPALHLPSVCPEGPGMKA